MKVSIRDSYKNHNTNDQLPDVRVFIDVFRASTTCLAILESGVTDLLVANDIEIIKKFHNQGYSVVSEVFDLGLDNSPTLVLNCKGLGEKALLKTSNLTTTISRNAFDNPMFIACFRNLSTVAKHLKSRNFNCVEIIPAGLIVQEKQNIEDTYCAEILSNYLLFDQMPKLNKKLLYEKIELKLKMQDRPKHYIDDLYYSIELDKTQVIPVVSKLEQNVFSVRPIP